MAANYWKSTHYKNWTSKLSLKDLRNSNPDDHINFSRDEIMRLHIHMISLISELGRHLNLRQTVISSAILFYKRFYLTCSFVNFDPRLILTTAVYIAAKIEECQIRIDYIMHAIRHLASDKSDPIISFKQTDILECEFYMVEALRFDLVVYHPYRPLIKILKDFGLEDECLPIAWSIVNDSYQTDVVMLFPPFVIALASIEIAIIYTQRDPADWFDNLNVNTEEIEAAKAIIVSMYETFQSTSKDEMRKLIIRLNQVVPNK